MYKVALRGCGVGGHSIANLKRTDKNGTYIACKNTACKSKSE